MAKPQNSPDEKQRIMAVRSRYYQALKDGMSKEEAAWYAQNPEADKEAVPAKPVATPKPPPFPQKPKKLDDDLTKINGVGVGTVKRLGEMGVNSYAQVAGWSEDDALRFDRQLNLRGRVIREDWVGQAKKLAAE